MTKKFTLAKDERLKSTKLIKHLFSEGKSFFATPFKVIYILHSENAAEGKKPISLQCGVAVSSKNFKRAVDRNRIKRLTREAYRLQKNPLKDMLDANKLQLNIFIIYTGKESIDFLQAKEKLGLILKKLTTLLNENNTTNT